jgi:hypothetical protein
MSHAKGLRRSDARSSEGQEADIARAAQWVGVSGDILIAFNLSVVAHGFALFLVPENLW